ncbi:Putative 115 kDa protein in type-1 retrotransposable element R1DM [Eumeta japonica]|uniref:115 kDa protein in type-1 retrotransposable element R1DM n=1 Tax=Eumeta variegata TaxID=151549 RepID=A0A4C1ZW11_EUMVA|nr:Putative 115 kDa protein in type-1 retrotransposable element R1DM [Eumeta japonica]
MVSLDIEGAFDNAWWPALETQLRALGPVNLHGLVRGYLRDREVVVKYAGGVQERDFKGLYKAFADDVVLMFSGQSASSIGGGQPRLARVHCWGVRNAEVRAIENKLDGADQKLKYDDPVVHMNGERISSVGEIRLLGLSPSSQGDVGSESGDREDHIHYRDRAYRSVRFVRLGTGDEEARRAKMLDAVQRSVALKACRAHRTVGHFVDRELERPVYFGDLPHPRTCPKSGTSVEDSTPDGGPSRRRRAAHFTDGSRIEGKVGAALTEWRDGRETWYSTLRLDPFCTVFQAEMVALQRAIRRVKNGKDGLVNIFSDSRSSLESACRNRGKRACGRSPGAPPSPRRRQRTMTGFAVVREKVIRAASLEEWQERYAEGGTGEITKCFFPRVEQAYRVLRKTEMTSHLAQTLTGHGGFSQYLHRFKLKDSPYCACDPAKIQDVLHVLEECPMFLRERVALETEIGVIVGRGEFPAIIEDDRKREKDVDGGVQDRGKCPKPTKGQQRLGRGEKLSQKATTTPPVLGTPLKTRKAKFSQPKCGPPPDVSAVCGATGTTQDSGGGRTGGCCRSGRQGIRANLSGNSPRPEPEKPVHLARPTPTGRLASESENSPWRRRRARGPKNISREVKESVIGKLSAMSSPFASRSPA